MDKQLDVMGELCQWANFCRLAVNGHKSMLSRSSVWSIDPPFSPLLLVFERPVSKETHVDLALEMIGVVVEQDGGK